MQPPGLADSLTTAIVVVCSGTLLIRWLNSAAEDLLGASRRRLVQTPLADRVGDDGEWLSRLREGHTVRAREILISPPGGRPAQRVDLGVTRWRPDELAADAPDLLVLELTAVDRQLRIAREAALQAQEQASRSLLRGLAHEIRNPLAGLRGAAQLLERELPDHPELLEYAQVIVHETDRLRALVDRLVGPATPLKREAINIHEITERVHALLRAEAPASVQLVTDYDPSLPPLWLDRDRMIQAVLNLGRNALQAAGEHGTIRIRTSSLRQFTIGTTRHRLVACVQVVDDGPGIPEELVDTLFQPMVSGHPQGSGLGLTIAQTLAGHHGGLIECESEPGKTVFRLCLPMESADE